MLSVQTHFMCLGMLYLTTNYKQYMLQIQAVEFTQEFTVMCEKCEGILLDLVKITDLVRIVQQSGDKIPNILDRYFMLAPNLSISTLKVDKTPVLQKNWPFYMLFVSSIRCQNCATELGTKILTISSEISNYEILGRLLINYKAIKIFNGREFMTQQVGAHFESEWQQSRQSQEFDHPSYLQPRDGREQHRKGRGQGKKGEVQKRNGREQKQQGEVQEREGEAQEREGINQYRNKNQMKSLRKQLQKQQNSKEDKELITQIFSTIDFFNSVLSTLEQRVTQTETVCQVLKAKVQRAVLTLRKT